MPLPYLKKKLFPPPPESVPPPQGNPSGGDQGGGGKFIQAAIKKPGQLHRDLGIPEGETIPPDVLQQAAGQGGKIGQRARFALNVLRKVRK